MVGRVLWLVYRDGQLQTLQERQTGQVRWRSSTLWNGLDCTAFVVGDDMVEIHWSGLGGKLIEQMMGVCYR